VKDHFNCQPIGEPADKCRNKWNAHQPNAHEKNFEVQRNSKMTDWAR